VPVIASGGAGQPDDFVRVFEEGEADAALAHRSFTTAPTQSTI
jgi:imidazole glycerol phosphate synthase subunit HisF